MNKTLKSLVAVVAILGLVSGAAFGGVLQTVFLDDFEDGNLGAGAAVWDVSGSSVDT